MIMKTITLMVSLLVCAINLQSQTKVIANWDMIPKQIINTTTKVGVVAFHESGVNVTFTINGGSPVTVTAPTYNDQSKVWEYWLTIDPAQYTDGPLTITATANPDSITGVAKQLPDLILYANSNGSLTNSKVVWADVTNGNDATGNGTIALPFKSIERAFKNVGQGGTVILKAGTYVMSENLANVNYNYWTTVTRDKADTAPNLGDVKINATAFPAVRFPFVKFDGISFYKSNADQTGKAKPDWSAMLDINIADRYTWFNNCEFYDIYGKDNRESFLFSANLQNPYYYLTGCYIHDISCVGGWWERGTTYNNIGDHIWWAKSNAFFVNITVNNLSPSAGNTYPHSDLLQWYGNADNVKVVNINPRCAGFMGGDNSLGSNKL
jgi:hypothetical protein